MVAAVLHTTLSSRRGRCGPQLVFILWRFGSLTAGVIASDTALPFRKRRSAQNINTFYFYSVFPFFSLVFFFFSSSRVCVMFTSLKLIFWLKVKTDPVWGFYASHSMMLIPREAKVTFPNAGERNAMFIVALYLVIKEHKICLWFLFFLSSWWDFSFATCPLSCCLCLDFPSSRTADLFPLPVFLSVVPNLGKNVNDSFRG